MAASMRFTTADLESLPDNNGNRYEIIDGELYVSKQPDWHHQYACFRIGHALTAWSDENKVGFVNLAPGIIFADDDSVAPDLVWIRADRLPLILQSDGKLHGAPDLVVELLSPGEANEHRDRELKLKLYSLRGVREYWIVDWRLRQIDVYRRKDAALALYGTLHEQDAIESPILPGFRAVVGTMLG
jgi:Uma2 family endonuclease